MNKELKLKLIDGIFGQSDTNDIILSMIDKKIEFNELNSFRDLVKLNKKDVDLQNRIDELKKERQLFIEFIQLNKHQQFKIQSEINIQIL